MKQRWIVALLVGFLSLPLPIRAEEEKAAANPGTMQAPVQGAEAGPGCMPGGGCCGACQAAAAAAKKNSDDSAATGEQREVGGCPCGRNKQKTM